MKKDIKNKINVLHLSAYLSMGGSSKLLIDSLKTFGEIDNINNILFVLSDKIPEVHRETIKNLSINCICLGDKESRSRRLILNELLKTVKDNNINVIHCDSLLPKKWAIILKLLMPKLKLVYTVHGTNIMNNSSFLSKLAGNVFFSVHTAISQAVYDECKESGIKNVVKIYNGVNLADYLNEPKKTSENECLKIINVSRIDYPTKGQDILIKALGECKKRNLNFECIIAGGVSGDPTDKKENQYAKNLAKFEEYKNMVKEFRIEDSVKFLGSRDDIPELLAQSDLFVLTSRIEGFGLVLIEAMTAGLPVIASNILGPKELIADGTNGLLFESENYLELADKIEDLYHNRQKLFEVALAGQEYARNFDIKAMCNRYIDLYNNVLGLKRQ